MKISRLILILFLSLACSIVFAQSKAPTKSSTLQILRLLYPHFTADQVSEKVTATKSPDEFLTSFIPYYYEALKSNPQLLNSLLTLTREYGWCTGDSHFSNFGTVLSDNNLPIFTANDVDDAGLCPLVTDALKFFTSVILTRPQFQFPLLFEAYQKGLSQHSNTLSPVTLRLLQKSLKDGRVPNPKKLVSPTRLARDANSRELNPDESTNLTNVITVLYGSDSKILDAYENSKSESGGSYGLERYRVLVQFGLRTARMLRLLNPQIIEFKRQVIPGVFPLTIPPIPNSKARISRTLQIERGQSISSLYNVVSFSNKDWLVRPLWHGDVKVKPEDFSDIELFQLTLDEFYILGSIHAQTANQNYVRGVLQTQPQDWYFAALNVAKFITSVFASLQ